MYASRFGNENEVSEKVVSDVTLGKTRLAKATRRYKMATLDDSPSLYLGQQWTHWAEKVEGKSKNGTLYFRIAKYDKANRADALFYGDSGQFDKQHDFRFADLHS